MAAKTRWVEYSAVATTSTYIGATTSGVGTRGYIKANSPIGDSFTIGPTNNNLQIAMDGGTYHTITLTSGIDLDARFVAKDITEKMHALNPSTEKDSWDYATCEWINNKLIIYSSNVGANSSVAVASGINTAYDTLGFVSSSSVAGTSNSTGTSNLYNGGITTSGIWEGMFDEVYTVIISKETTIGSPSPGGSNIYVGTFTAGGQYNRSDKDLTYTITIDGTNGLTAGGGTKHVPTFSWTSDDDDGGPVEILYANYWYSVGIYGLRVKWSDDVLGDGDTWTIACIRPTEAVNGSLDAPPGTAQYIWTSTRGDDCTSGVLTTSDTEMVRVGTRGLYIKFTGGSNNLRARDEFRIVCKPPQPLAYDIISLNYGNVTVTTESPIKVVVFEIISGAVMMTSVRFGLQNDGSFKYHGTGDTYFRYGTIGAANTAGASPIEGKEWRTGLVPGDLSGTLPSYLYANKANLNVVATADDSEPVGNYNGALVSDFVFVCIRLGADETGSNSGINHRLYFDYS